MWESRVLQRAFERLELHEGKLSRAVLRGGGGGDVTSLPDTWVGNHPGLPGPEFPTRGLGPSFVSLPVESGVVVQRINRRTPIGSHPRQGVVSTSARVLDAAVRWPGAMLCVPRPPKSPADRPIPRRSVHRAASTRSPGDRVGEVAPWRISGSWPARDAKRCRWETNLGREAFEPENCQRRVKPRAWRRGGWTENSAGGGRKCSAESP